MGAGLRVAMRHHRGGLSSPKQLPGLVGWYDANSIVGLNDGDAVGTWSDISGAGNDLTSITTQRPLYKIVDGQSVVRFDGSDDFLSKAALLASASAFTVFSVLRTIGAGEASGRLWTFTDANTYNLFVNGTHPTASFGFYANQSAGVTDLGGDTETLSVITVRISSATTGESWINGAGRVAFDPQPTNTGTGRFFIGSGDELGNSASNSEHCAHLIYSSAVPDSSRSDVEHFLGARFKVGVT